MSDYFFDSSGLVKRYLREVGSGWVQRIVNPTAANRIFVSQITQVEIMPAVDSLSRARL
ncbi:MAG: hypothetical protein U0694_03660 [Anaerolineae bacterium]